MGGDPIADVQALDDLGVVGIAEAELDLLPAPGLLAGLVAGSIIQGDIRPAAGPSNRIDRNAGHVVPGLDLDHDLGAESRPKLVETLGDVFSSCADHCGENKQDENDHGGEQICRRGCSERA